ncbi:MZM1 [Candida pseudojiufengensis]|uniref:MZM1 n=1 Tax=Candida pseudojiufengensis TaxID=497109 RepID=UPI002224314C|nr:MZM1 [Candida pseudojiufengensis]KAI5959071.1 MZM1 [Candida pseudojiufengensis]
MSLTTKQAYRQALKSINTVFKNDYPILNAAKQQIKTEIYKNSNLKNESEINEAITKLKEISKFLISNLVQGELKSDGKYFLNFHDKIELGDNESIKLNKNEMGSLSGKKGNSIRSIK